MSERKRNILLSIFLSLLIVTLMSFSLTQARYSKEPESGSDISGDIDFVVSQSIVIESVDDFFTAIENGYTNIQISDEVDNPLVISGGVADVNSDLTIDLNGHEIQRNNREPMLDIQEGVRLTITDSKGGGGFYNPVGSVLRISGGTLTVTNGLFESGPRNGVSMAEADGKAEHASEYATGSGSVYSTPVGASASGSKSVIYYEKSGTSYTAGASASMPILDPYVEDSKVNEGRFVVNGNMYFENDATVGGCQISADTYLYYTLEGDNIDNTTIATDGSADFYYEYYVTQDENTGNVTYAGNSAGENTILVTIYGYKNAKGAANPDGTEIPDYAAIQMQSGNIYVRGGGYTSYFGKNNTYCVYATGGNMAVENGTFEAHGNGTCVNMAIINAGGAGDSEESLRIAHGSFYSQVGDTIGVAAGNMRVTGGSFHKDASAGTGSAAGANNAIISISGGSLVVAGTADGKVTFDLKGSYMYGIESSAESRVGAAATRADAGQVTVTNANFTFNGGSNAGAHTTNYGISSSAGTIDVAGCIFVLPDQNSRGISVENGTVTVGGATQDTGAPTDGSKDLVQNTDRYSYFYVDSNVNSYGVYAGSDVVSTENITVNMNAVQLFVGQKRVNGAKNEGGAGVYLNAGNKSQINLGEVYVLAAGNSVRGIVAESGSISQTDSGRSNYTDKLVVITGATYSEYESGKTCFPRSIDSYTNAFVADNPLVAATTSSSGSHGVYSAGGSITLNSAFVAQFSANAAGVYSSGGSITVADAFDVFVNIAENTRTTNVLATTAVSVEENTVNSETAALTFDGDVDIRTDGLGITARGGATIRVFGDLDMVSTRGTGIYVNNGNLTLGSEKSPNTVNITTTIDKDTKWGNNVTTHYDGVTVEGGSLMSYGTFKVTHKGVANDAQRGSDYLNFKIKSFAVRVEQSTNADTDTKVTIQAGNIQSVVDGEGSSQTGGGGGLFVGGGTVTLGKENRKKGDDLTIIANGNHAFNNDNDVYIDFDSNHGNWAYKLPRTGGHAVQVGSVGSSTQAKLTVYYGTYQANMGNGILVSNGTVDIVDGTFIGADSYKNNADDPMSGAAASYGFKLYGGEITIETGTFGQSTAVGGGAFIMGTSGAPAKATIKSGTFKVAGTAGVSVYQYADVVFGQEEQDNSGLTLYGNSNALSIESHTGSSSVKIYGVKIYGGAFSGGQDGIWYGEAATKLEILGGTFKADENASDSRDARAGLNLDSGASPDVKISGGTFETDSTDDNAIRANSDRVTYGAILEDSAVATVTYRSGDPETETGDSTTIVNDTKGGVFRTYHVSKVEVTSA